MEFVTTARELSVKREQWPIAGRFAISRGARTEINVVVVELSGGGAKGRGECSPYPHYGETPEGVVELLRGLADDMRRGASRRAVQSLLPPGAARNALDCALWDWEAKRSGRPVWQLAGLKTAPQPVVTAYTVSLDTPEAMAAQAARNKQHPLLKLKLGGDGRLDIARVAAVRAQAPQARLIADANEAWTPGELLSTARALAEMGVEVIEQPLPAGRDDILRDIEHPLIFCADESAHSLRDFPDLRGKYDMINIKLDKTGGLTEALQLRETAVAAGMKIMVGSMLGTSLAMAQGMVIAQQADIVDLDSSLLLARDRDFALSYNDGRLNPPDPRLWG